MPARSEHERANKAVLGHSHPHGHGQSQSQSQSHGRSLGHTRHGSREAILIDREVCTTKDGKLVRTGVGEDHTKHSASQDHKSEPVNENDYRRAAAAEYMLSRPRPDAKIRREQKRPQTHHAQSPHSLALRDYDLTPGLDSGVRARKQGLPIVDLQRWLVQTSSDD
jgi:hypothetical protein